jgi:predicted dehydrogenase
MSKLNIAIVGCGYWGPNLLRNFSQIPDCHVTACCDLDDKKLARMKTLYPAITATRNFEEIVADSSIDAVAIATPVRAHAALAKACLERDKHVLLEKPMATSSKECLELIRLAEARRRILMVGHTFEYAAAVNKAKQIIDSGELGEIYYISCVRVNLGLFQPDINVIWDLAPHDIAIILYLLRALPVTVNSQGKAHFKQKIEDVATITLNFPNGTIAFIHNSWLDPDKIRKITIVGSKRYRCIRRCQPQRKIRIYDRATTPRRITTLLPNFIFRIATAIFTRRG